MGSTSGSGSTQSSSTSAGQASGCNAVGSWQKSCSDAVCTNGVLTAKCDMGTLTGPSLDVTKCPKNTAGQYEVSNCNGNLVCGSVACSCANSRSSCPAAPAPAPAP